MTQPLISRAILYYYPAGSSRCSRPRGRNQPGTRNSPYLQGDPLDQGTGINQYRGSSGPEDPPEWADSSPSVRRIPLFAADNGPWLIPVPQSGGCATSRQVNPLTCLYGIALIRVGQEHMKRTQGCRKLVQPNKINLNSGL